VTGNDAVKFRLTFSLTIATSHPSDDVLGSFFHRPWFSRMWTVQEVALARGDNVIVYNGPDPSDQIPWIVLIAGIDALVVCNYEWVDLSKTVKLHKHLLTMIILKRYPIMKQVYKMKEGDLVQEAMVWPIMCDAREKEATDAKDKVFALYGVFQETGIAEALPPPDYSKSVEDIYRELTIACIESDKWLYVLFDAPSDLRYLRPNLASWVPDWSDPGWRGKGNADSRIAVSRDRFCAAGPVEPVWTFSADGRQLHLHGKIVDEIIFCGEPICCLADGRTIADLKSIRSDASKTAATDQFKLDLQEAYTTLKSWVGICSWYDKYPGTSESAAQAFRRTLMQDFEADKDNDSLAQARDFDAWFKIMSSSSPDVEIFRAHYASRLGVGYKDDAFVEGVISQSPPETIPLGASQMRPGGHFHNLARTFSNKRGYFITEQGRMGTAAARIESGQHRRSKAVNLVQAGDKVAVVAGLAMPMVLRPVACKEYNPASGIQYSSGRMYTLVTHAYVHGIMYGEAWEDQSRQLEDIVLV